jgi:hypothetical protein
MSKGGNTVRWIKGQRISWLGHLERMEENRMPKLIFSQELEGPRRRVGPRRRWKEEVERNLHVLGVRRWRDLATDRKNGGILFDRPKPTASCSANGRRRRVVNENEQNQLFVTLFDLQCNNFLSMKQMVLNFFTKLSVLFPSKIVI